MCGRSSRSSRRSNLHKTGRRAYYMSRTDATRFVKVTETQPPKCQGRVFQAPPTASGRRGVRQPLVPSHNTVHVPGGHVLSDGSDGRQSPDPWGDSTGVARVSTTTGRQFVVKGSGRCTGWCFRTSSRRCMLDVRVRVSLQTKSELSAHQVAARTSLAKFLRFEHCPCSMRRAPSFEHCVCLTRTQCSKWGTVRRKCRILRALRAVDRKCLKSRILVVFQNFVTDEGSKETRLSTF